MVQADGEAAALPQDAFPDSPHQSPPGSQRDLSPKAGSLGLASIPKAAQETANDEPQQSLSFLFSVFFASVWETKAEGNVDKTKCP